MVVVVVDLCRKLWVHRIQIGGRAQIAEGKLHRGEVFLFSLGFIPADKVERKKRSYVVRMPDTKHQLNLMTNIRFFWLSTGNS